MAEKPKARENPVTTELNRIKEVGNELMYEIMDTYAPEHQSVTEMLEKCKQGKRELQDILD